MKFWLVGAQYTLDNYCKYYRFDAVIALPALIAPLVAISDDKLPAFLIANPVSTDGLLLHVSETLEDRLI